MGRGETAASSKTIDRGSRKGADSWLYGTHAVLAALANPNRHCHQLIISNPDEELFAKISKAGKESERARPQPKVTDRRSISETLHEGAVHQGIAGNFDPLPTMAIETLCKSLTDTTRAPVVLLDQATDPRKIGAIMRSSAAFGAKALIMQDRHAPEATGTLAKAASGALETVPLVYVTNIVRTIETLKKAGFWCVGLDGYATEKLGKTPLPEKAAIIMGAEGSGLRRLVQENCDILVKIPINNSMESLNLSNATAITLYEWARGGKS